MSERRRLRPSARERPREDAALRLVENGRELKELIEVNAKKWAERGESELLKKIGRQLEDMTSATRGMNPYDELVLSALECAYEDLTGRRWDAR
jgi:hypothetical protein